MGLFHNYYFISLLPNLFIFYFDYKISLSRAFNALNTCTQNGIDMSPVPPKYT